MPQKELIRKYLDGLADEDEARKVRMYLAADDSDWGPLQECFAEAADPEPGVEGNLALRDDVLAALRQQLYPQQLGEPMRIRAWWRFAAAAAVVAALGVSVVWFYGRSRPRPETAVIWKSLRNTDVHTRLGILPDGSQVYLTPYSTLYYPPDFPERREIRLEGEAFFDVVRDDRHPFMVHSGPLLTQVLGTAFNIESYSEEKTVRISLAQGQVAVRSDSAASLFRVLKAGDVLTYNRETRSVTTERLKMNNIHDWEDGFMLFNEVPVTDALGRIARRYRLGLSIHDPEALRTRHVTGIFKQQSLAQTLDIILFISRYKYRIRGNTLEVFPK